MGGKRKRIGVGAAALLAGLSAGRAWAVSETQNFNASPADWTVSGNASHFGFANTNFAGGAGTGEAQMLPPFNSFGYYADTNFNGVNTAINLDIPITATAKLGHMDRSNGIQFFFGYFNTSTSAFMGFDARPTSAYPWSGRLINNTAGTNFNQQVGHLGNPIGVGQALQYTMTLTWNPTGGVNGGGLMQVTLAGNTNGGGVPGTVSLDLTPAQRAAFNTTSFNAFGFYRPSGSSGGSGDAAKQIADDLTYTTGLFNNSVITADSPASGGNVDLGLVLRNSGQFFTGTFDKTGSQATTYAVAGTGDVIASDSGSLGTGAVNNTAYGYSLDTSNYNASASGGVTIDNTAADSDAAGQGSADPDDSFTVTANVGMAAVGATQATFGTAATGPVAPAAAYDNLASQTTTGVNGAVGTEGVILDGDNTTGGTATVAMAWRSRSVLEAGLGNVISDVTDLTGIDSGELFVLQMSYDPALIIGTTESAAAALGKLYLATMTEGTDGQHGSSDDAWLHAGNTGLFPTPVLAAYNSGFFTLGRWGVDTASNTVWAVMDHNSQFGSFFAGIPEPASLALLAMGLPLMLARRRPNRDRNLVPLFTRRKGLTMTKSLSVVLASSICLAATTAHAGLATDFDSTYPGSPALEVIDPTQDNAPATVGSSEVCAQTFIVTTPFTLDAIFIEYEELGSNGAPLQIRLYPVTSVNAVSGNMPVASGTDLLNFSGIGFVSPGGGTHILEFDLTGLDEIVLPAGSYAFQISPDSGTQISWHNHIDSPDLYTDGRAFRSNEDFSNRDFVLGLTAVAVPEPASLALLGLGASFLLRRRRNV